MAHAANEFHFTAACGYVCVAMLVCVALHVASHAVTNTLMRASSVARSLHPRPLRVDDLAGIYALLASLVILCLMSTSMDLTHTSNPAEEDVTSLVNGPGMPE